MRAKLRVKLLSTIALAAGVGLVLAPSAAATLSLKVESVRSKAGTVRALTIVDVDGVADRVEILTEFLSDPVTQDTVQTTVIGNPDPYLAPLPQGCRTLTEDEADLSELVVDGPAVACLPGTFDLVGLFTGRGNDSVSIHTFKYPSLGLKQILSPRRPVVLNAFLGPGRDVFSGAGGTDAAYGQAGKDHVSGAGGNDLLFGGRGADRLFGGNRTDFLLGGHGRDRCEGSGKDRARSCEQIRIQRY